VYSFWLCYCAAIPCSLWPPTYPDPHKAYRDAAFFLHPDKSARYPEAFKDVDSGTVMATFTASRDMALQSIGKILHDDEAENAEEVVDFPEAAKDEGIKHCAECYNKASYALQQITMPRSTQVPFFLIWTMIDQAQQEVQVMKERAQQEAQVTEDRDAASAGSETMG
jgi:hypothetical protein